MGVPQLWQGVAGRFTAWNESISLFPARGLTRLAVDFSTLHHKILWLGVEALAAGDRVAFAQVARDYLLRVMKVLVGAGFNDICMVFDGNELPQKAGVLAGRVSSSVSAQDALKNCEHARGSVEWMKTARQAFARRQSWQSDILKAVIAELASQFSVTIVHMTSPYEADGQLAYLVCVSRQYDVVWSEDADMFLYGVKFIIRNMAYHNRHRKDQGRYASDHADLVDSSSWDRTDKLKACGAAECAGERKCSACGWAVGLTGHDLIDATTISGNDISGPGLHGLGLMTACELIRTNGSVEAVIASRKQQVSVNAVHISDLVRNARLVFRYHIVLGEDGEARYLNVPGPTVDINGWNNVIGIIPGCYGGLEVQQSDVGDESGAATEGDVDWDLPVETCSLAQLEEKTSGMSAWSDAASPAQLVWYLIAQEERANGPCDRGAWVKKIAQQLWGERLEKEAKQAEERRANELDRFERTFGTTDYPALDRALTFNEKQNLLRLRICDVPGAAHFAEKDGVRLNPKGQLDNFDALTATEALRRRVLCSVLIAWLQSRCIFVSGQLKADQLAAVRLQMLREVELGDFQIHCPADGLYERQRLARLVNHGLITEINAPDLLPSAPPPLTDKRWRFVQRTDLEGVNCVLEMITHADNCYGAGNGNAHVAKGLRKYRSGRAAHAVVYHRSGEMFVSVRVGKSYKVGDHNVVLTFQKQVGRDEAPERCLLRASCPQCTAGAHHGGCSHVFTALALLVHLQSGHLVAGNAGDDEKAWAKAKAPSSMPVQSTKAISVLVDGGKLASFTGIRAGTSPLPSDLISKYILAFQQRAHAGIPATIVEMHAGVPTIRNGPVPRVPTPPTAPRTSPQRPIKRK